MNVVSFTYEQIVQGASLAAILLAGVVYGAFYYGWQRGFARGWKMGEEWGVKALVNVGELMRSDEGEK